MSNEILNMIESVEKETLEKITDPSSQNLYLLHSCLRRIYISGLFNMVIFKNFDAINELLEIQTEVKLTKREKALIIQKILQGIDGSGQHLKEKYAIQKIESMPEADKEMYSFSEFANEKQAAYQFEQTAIQMKQSLTARIQAIHNKYSKVAV